MIKVLVVSLIGCVSSCYCLCLMRWYGLDEEDTTMLKIAAVNIFCAIVVLITSFMLWG